MAELKIAPEKQSSSAPAVLLSLFVLALIAVAVFYFNPHHVADFRVDSVDPFAPHTTFNALDAPGSSNNGTHVLSAPTSASEDDLYLLARVRLTDKLRLPLFLTGATAHVTFADGTEAEANLLTLTDLKRLEVIFPELRDRVAAPIADDDTVEPGQTRVGTMVLPFPGHNAAAWQTKKAATLTLTLRNQKPLSAVLP